jgi:hypothetical protein
MQYEYKVESIGTSSWSLLEGVAGQLQDALDNPYIGKMAQIGWELWQVNTMSADNARGFLLIFRRPKT